MIGNRESGVGSRVIVSNLSVQEPCNVCEPRPNSQFPTPNSLFFLLFSFFFFLSSLHAGDWAFPDAPCGHRGPVSALFQKGDIIVSAGEDGFLDIWNTNSASAVDRFQVSRYKIIAMAGRPEKNEACVVESDGLGLYWISVWNYRERRKLFALQFSDPIGYITYSAGGKYIIAAKSGRTALVMIDANSGGELQPPQSLTGTISLAATGRSDRNMMVYTASGEISYWDFDTGNRTHYFSAPPNMLSAALFGNNRYLAGINSQGLSVVHAASGGILGRDASIPNGSLLCADGDDFLCLVQKNNTAAELYRYTIDSNGGLVMRKNFSVAVSGAGSRLTAMNTGTGSALFGTSSGSLIVCDPMGNAGLFSAKEQTFITDAAVSGSTVAFVSGNGYIGFIPLDFQRLSEGSAIHIEKNESAYNRVTAFNTGTEQEYNSGSGTSQFIFWHDRNTRLQPAIRSSEPESKFKILNGINAKAPIHSVASFGGKALFLDTIGNLSVADPNAEKNTIYTFSSVGIMTAAFIDSNRLILGRSAVSGNTPFLMININTGETVPLPHPAQAVAALYRGGSGGIYAVTVSSQTAENNRLPNEITKTQVILLNIANSAAGSTGADTIRLIDLPGEDIQFSLVESPDGYTGSIAATIGGEGAIYSGSGVYKLDRTSGLPHRLLEGGSSLISLDSDGNIAWHDSRNGRLTAVFSLSPSGWTLRTESRTISGQITKE